MSGALTVDGKLDELTWWSARILHLVSSEFGSPFPDGGEARVATCGQYLWLSRTPFRGRPTTAQLQPGNMFTFIPK